MERAYTLKVPETVSLPDLTAASMSNPNVEEKSPEPPSSREEAYEFQSANNDVEGFWDDSSVPVNHACATFISLSLSLSLFISRSLRV